MPRDAIFPSKEVDFDGFVNVAVPFLVTNGVRLGINAAQCTALTNALANWTAAYAQASNPMTRTRPVVAAKNEAQDALKNLQRETCRNILPALLTAIDRATLHLPLRDRSTPAPVPTSRPKLRVDVRNRLQHTLHYYDEESGRKAKPKGVKGCEIWYFIGGLAAPTDLRQYHLLAFSFKASYIANFDLANAGQPVWYMLRWKNTRNEPGPWSAAVMATIAG